MLGKIGKESIKRRIALFDIDTLELDIALGARKMLGNLLIDNVNQASAGAATFYVWVRITSKKKIYNKKKKNELKSKFKKWKFIQTVKIERYKLIEEVKQLSYS